ncbi:MAG: Xylose isomerase domain protein barrel [Verrucomicrobiales bacterium]|nr:Xylose isomerase domain protein barrel [Verrucomicrobiales bacterium]
MTTSRRQFLGTATTATTAGVLGAALAGGRTAATARGQGNEGGAGGASPYYRIQKGRLRQSVVHWNMNPLTVEELAKGAAAMGMSSVELVGPEHWPLLKSLGLTCAIAPSHGFSTGFAHQEEHAGCVEALTKSIDACTAHGVPGVITFSGFRRGLDDETARRNMIEGLKKILPHAEKNKVTLCVEVLNSRVNESMKGHPDYWLDRVEPAVEICQAIGSERMKILFDIYHVQIMQGDVIRRYRQCQEFVGHIHTAGNPGRGELDDQQEINYPPIMRAIAESGYKGFIGQEFIPRAADKLAALSDAVRLCDV